MDRSARQDAADTLIGDLLLSDDATYVTGKVDALQSEVMACAPAALCARMIARWESVVDLHWRTMLHMARLCRWFRANPDHAMVRDHHLGCDATLPFARGEMRHQLDSLVRARRKLNFWTAERDKLAIHLPAPANNDAALSGKVA